jgi:large subunit ribosomal protein L18
MSKTTHKKTSQRVVTRMAKKTRIRRKIKAHRDPLARLVVFRSNTNLYAQVVDDGKSHTIVQANTREKDFEKLKSKKNLAAAKELGLLIGKRAVAANVSAVAFDRNGYDFHGRIKAVADGAREAGLKF